MWRSFLSILAGCVLLLFTCSSCSKGGEAAQDEHPVDNDSTTPVVSISTPTTNQVYKSGDIIEVSGTVTDNSLYQGSIRIVDDASNTIVKQQLYEIHGYQTYNFDLLYQANVDEPADYTITVQYEDHGLNMGSQSVKVKINP